jgi:hypothetical protein
VFTRAHHWALFWARWNKSTPSTPYFSKTHFDIILPVMPRSSKWSLSFRILKHYLVCISTHVCFMFSPSHPLWFHDPNNFGEELKLGSSHYAISMRLCAKKNIHHDSHLCSILVSYKHNKHFHQWTKGKSCEV